MRMDVRNKSHLSIGMQKEEISFSAGELYPRDWVGKYIT